MYPIVFETELAGFTLLGFKMVYSVLLLPIKIFLKIFKKLG